MRKVGIFPNTKFMKNVNLSGVGEFFLEYCIASVNEIFGICFSSQSFSLGKLET